MLRLFFPCVLFSNVWCTMNSNNIFLTLQFLEVPLNGRKYSPKPSIYYWARLVCINVLFSFRVTGKKWTELVQTVRVPVPNCRCLGDNCLTHPAVTDSRAVNAHLREQTGFPTAVSIPCMGPAASQPASLRVLVSVDGKMRLHHDCRWRCFQNTVYRMRCDSTDTSEKTIQDRISLITTECMS